MALVLFFLCIFVAMNQENRISVVINTYNAARHLERVLDAVEGFDEVLVCDMESTDDTCQIASRRGCRVVTFPKGDAVCAEPARTFAIQSAASHWVLVVDADELVTPELRNYLYEQISRPDCPEGMYIPRRNIFLGRYEQGFANDHQLRFFIREGTVWPPYVHTFPTVQGRVVKIPANADNVCLLHLADENVGQIVDKNNRYADGEVLKKAGRHYGIAALLLKPHWKFFSEFVLRGGFRDGRRGIIKAGLKAFYQFTLMAKITEQELRREEGGDDNVNHNVNDNDNDNRSEPCK